MILYMQQNLQHILKYTPPVAVTYYTLSPKNPSQFHAFIFGDE